MSPLKVVVFGPLLKDLRLFVLHRELLELKFEVEGADEDGRFPLFPLLVTGSGGVDELGLVLLVDIVSEQ